MLKDSSKRCVVHDTMCTVSIPSYYKSVNEKACMYQNTSGEGGGGGFLCLVSI